MPLHEIDGESYLAVTKLYVNSTDDRGGGTNSRFRVDLNTELRNVVSVELTGYSIPRSVTPTFSPNKNHVDFHVIEDGITRFDYSFQLPSTPFTIDTLTEYLEDTMDQLVSDEIGASLYFIVAPGENNVLEFEFRWAGSLHTYTWGLDLKTGPNATTSAYAELGFEQNDYTSTFGGFRNAIINAFVPVIFDTYRYIDISAEEIPELQPIKRVFLGNAASYTLVDQNVAPRTRIITNTDGSVRLRHLTINAILANGVEPLEETYDLEFTIYNLEAVEKVPEWVKERFLV